MIDDQLPPTDDQLARMRAGILSRLDAPRPAARRRRRFGIALGGLVVAGALTGGALVITGLPGETTVTPISAEARASGTGSGTIELGTPPAAADVVVVELHCTGDGHLTVPTAPGAGTTGGASELSCADRHDFTIRDAALPPAGTTGVAITADPGVQWEATAAFAGRTSTDWGVNANGQTYGVPNERGTPDLVAAQAWGPDGVGTGPIGYYDPWAEPAGGGEGWVPVTEADGETIIGWFPVANDSDTLPSPPPVPAR